MATQVPHGENRDDLRRVAGNAFPLLLYVALRHLKGSTQGCVLTHLAVVKASVLKAGAVAPGHCPKAREDLTVFPDKVWSVSDSATLWTVARQAPLSMEFSRQEYWSGLPFISPRKIPDPGIEPEFLKSPVLAGVFFTTNATWEYTHTHTHTHIYTHTETQVHTYRCV